MQSTLWKMVCESGNYTSDAEKEQLYALLMEYSDVFSLSSGELGRTAVTKHHINTGDAQPVHLGTSFLAAFHRLAGMK